MVLSNKKLKQKLRSLLTESISASESTQSNKASSNEELDSIKELLTSKSRKKLQPATKKRRKKLPLGENSYLGDGNGETQEGIEEKKSKKRKEEDEVDEELIERRRLKREKRENRKKEKANKEEEEKREKASASVESEERLAEPTEIDESEIKKVYVGGIPYYSSEDDIRSFFEGCGTVTEMDCMTFPETGKFRGIAFLTFKTEAAAKRALDLDGADMGGFYSKIQPYKTQQRVQKPDFTPEVIDGYNRAYVGNLSWDITEDDLKKLFSDCKVSSIRFGTDKETGDFKGYAHVDFSDSVSLTVALTLDQKVVCGRPVRISRAVPPKKGVDVNSQKKLVEKKEEGGGTGGSSKKEEDGGTGGSLKKKKRRTCYECGVPGHLFLRLARERRPPKPKMVVMATADCRCDGIS